MGTHVQGKAAWNPSKATRRDSPERAVLLFFSFFRLVNTHHADESP
jgi:hypothetical protein